MHLSWILARVLESFALTSRRISRVVCVSSHTTAVVVDDDLCFGNSVNSCSLNCAQVPTLNSLAATLNMVNLCWKQSVHSGSIKSLLDRARGNTEGPRVVMRLSTRV